MILRLRLLLQRKWRAHLLWTMANQMVHLGKHHKLIWHSMLKMEAKLDKDFIRNSQFIDLVVYHHQMLKMIFRQFGMLKFRLKTKMTQNQDKLLIHFIKVIAQETPTVLKMLWMMVRADIEEQTQAKARHWSLQVQMHFSQQDQDLMKTSIVLFLKINKKWQLPSLEKEILQELVEMDQLMEDLNLKDQSRHLLLQSCRNISLRKKQKSQMMQNQEDLKFNQLDQELQMLML